MKIYESNVLERLVFFCKKQVARGDFSVRISVGKGRDTCLPCCNLDFYNQDGSSAEGHYRQSHNKKYHFWRDWVIVSCPQLGRDGRYLVDMSREERLDFIDGLHIIYDLLDWSGIRILSTDIDGRKDIRGDVFHYLSEPFWKERCDTHDQARELDNATGGCLTIVSDFIACLKQWSEGIKKVDDGRYARLCMGHLKNSEYNEKLKEMKSLTEKIVRYIPDVSKFADAFANASDEVIGAYKKLYGRFFNWPSFDFKRGRGNYSYKKIVESLLDEMKGDRVLLWQPWEIEEAAKNHCETYFEKHYGDLLEDAKWEVREEVRFEFEAKEKVIAQQLDEKVEQAVLFLLTKFPTNKARKYLAKVIGLEEYQFNQKYK